MTDSNPIALSEAVRLRIVDVSLDALRRASTRPGFPSPVARDGVSHLYDVADLQAWQNRKAHRPATECREHPGPEVWRPVPGASGYKVSSRGGFRSLDRVGKDGRSLRGVVFQPVTTSTVPYPSVKYTLDNGEQTDPRCVHVIELEAFTGPCPPGQEACHLDDVPTHNCLENLRWDTPEGNLADRLRNKPPRICIRCEVNEVTRGGLRCHPCVVDIGEQAARLLECDVRLSEAAKRLGYPSLDGLHTLARKYGGYGQSQSVVPLPAALAPSPRRRITLRDRLRRRDSA